MLKSTLLLLITSAFCLLSYAAHAGEDGSVPVAPVFAQGVDVTALVNDLRALLVTPSSAVRVYHWSGAPENSVWSGPLRSDDPAGVEFVREASQKYWAQYGTKSSDFYGVGLYVAADPIFTHEYGGPKWTLVQIEIPKGFRALDLTLKLATAPLKQPIRETLKKLGCEAPSALVDLLKAGSLRTFRSAGLCNQAMAEIFKKHLRIDGFFYAYGSAGFAECTTTFRGKAMVITDEKWLDPSLIRVFNAQTPDAEVERTFLQSLFYRSSEFVTTTLEHSTHVEMRKKYVEQIVLPSYPGYEITTIRFDCGKFGTCPREVYLCRIGKPRDPLNCPVIAMPPLPIQKYPETISKNLIPLVNKANLPGLLWNDLDGKPTSSDIEMKIKTSLLCEEGQLTPLKD